MKKDIPNWEELYQKEKEETLPWFFSDMDHDLERMLQKLKLSGRDALDLGTGPGTQAIALAKKGFKVTAVDISATAVRQARSRAERENLKIDFLQDDILATRLERSFDLIVDRGCFHVFDREKRKKYIENVRGLLKENGFLLLKCFSNLEPGDEGPYRFAPHELKDLFSPVFRIRSIEDSYFQGTKTPLPRALFCVFEKSDQKSEAHLWVSV